MLLHLLQQGRLPGCDWEIVFLEDGKMVAQAQALGVKTFVFPSGRLSQVPRYAATVFRLAAHLRRSRPDCIFGWMGKPHLYSGPSAILSGFPALWYQLGIPYMSNRMDRITTLMPAKGIVACSKAGADAQQAMKPVRPTKIVYPGVELERFDLKKLPSPSESRRLLGLPETGKIIGIVGRLQRWKGLHTLIEAMPDILQYHPDTFAVLVGGEHTSEPEYPAYLQSRIDELGLQRQVLLAGMQGNVEQWMQAMDIVAHASDNEPFGIVIIEAMALGKPVIAGANGGPTEIITDGVNGFLTPYNDPGALAKAALYYLDNREMALKMGQAAQERAQNFSTSRYARNLISAIGELLE